MTREPRFPGQLSGVLSNGEAEIVDGTKIRFTFALWQVALVLILGAVFTMTIWLTVRDMSRNLAVNTSAVEKLNLAVTELREVVTELRYAQRQNADSVKRLRDEGRRRQLEIDRLADPIRQKIAP